MIPVYRILHSWAPVAAIVNTRIFRDFAGDQPAADYVVWSMLADVPDNHLSGPPPSDRYSVSIDTFSTTEARSDALVKACRDAIEADGHAQVQTIQSLGRETSTALWRYNISADIFRNR